MSIGHRGEWIGWRRATAPGKGGPGAVAAQTEVRSETVGAGYRSPTICAIWAAIASATSLRLLRSGPAVGWGWVSALWTG